MDIAINVPHLNPALGTSATEHDPKHRIGLDRLCVPHAVHAHLVMLKKNSSRIGFLHIPKTAGVSIGKAFAQHLGADQCALFNGEMTDDTFTHKRFVSGHLYLGDITRNAFLFTFLRDPIKQLASHLMWIDHYNLPHFQQELEAFPKNIQARIRPLADTDLSSAKSIDSYLQELPCDSALRIINLQSEMLAFKQRGVISMSDRELADIAIRKLGELDFFGISERIQAEMDALFQMLEFGSSPEISHLNSSPSERIVDHKLPDVRRVLSKYVQADQRLYEYALNAKTPGTNRKNLLSLIRGLYRRIARD